MQTLLMISMLLLSGDPLPLGKSTVEVRFGEVPLKLFVYKPADFHDGSMLRMETRSCQWDRARS